jgi:hypothetical protein
LLAVAGLLVGARADAQEQAAPLPPGPAAPAPVGPAPVAPVPFTPAPAAMPKTLLVPLPDPDGTHDPVVAPTNASFVDPASPWNVVRLRFDAAYNMNRPTQAEYFMTGSNDPSKNVHGLPLPEPRIDYQEASLYAEYAFLPQFSLFVDAPVRWLNPQANIDYEGPGDVRGGFKLLGFQTNDFTGTFQFQASAPTGKAPKGLGPGHPSLQANVLTNWQPIDRLIVEGSYGLWMPVDDTRYGSEILLFGLAVSYGDRPPDAFWWAPVLEFTGWNIIRGREQVVYSPTNFFIQSAGRTVIANGNIGVRAGFGCVGDIYVGYSRALTGEVWYKDLWRIELRWRY